MGMPRMLTSMDLEPGTGSVVRDSAGRLWKADTCWSACWVRVDGDEPETWTVVAGNNGPVEVVKLCGWVGEFGRVLTDLDYARYVTPTFDPADWRVVSAY